MSKQCNLKIGSLNIGGNAKVKCLCPDVVEIVNSHDIFVILESWLGADDSCPHMDGFLNFRSERKKKCKARRNSGGIIVYIRKNIAKGVTKIENSSTEAIWMKLDKLYFGLYKDLYLCAQYIAPRNSPQYIISDDGHDRHDKLSNEIDIFSTMGDVAIIGDLNSRVGKQQEAHFNIDTDSNNADITKPVLVIPRNSYDSQVNAHGRKLLQIMTNHEMLLANGRICGDMAGNLTCCQYNGSSVVDALIAQRDLIPLINYFKVLPFDWYSDHAVISACFAVTVNTAVAVPDGWEKVCNCFQNWNEDTKDKFLKKLSDPVIANKLNTFCETNFSCGNAAAEQFTVIMGGVIKSVFRRDRRKRPKLTNRKIPYNYQLQIAKRTFKKYKDQFAKDPENLDRRDRYLREKRLYKKIIYKVKKNSHEYRLNKIASLEQNDTKSFWKNVKKLLTPQEDGPSIISHPNWFRHFYCVLNARNSAAVNPQFLDYVTAALPTLEDHTELSAPLNSPITGEELRNVMKSVKSGKATYLDDISNDAIKLGLPILEEALLHVFNIVTSVQTFPGTWNVGLITPLHKKGDKLNADNYRGIIISSCVGKIYLKIMTSRIEKYMSTNNYGVYINAVLRKTIARRTICLF